MLIIFNQIKSLTMNIITGNRIRYQMEIDYFYKKLLHE